ncbi:MAG: hypothetical protein RIC15_02775 [Vicingaceae bacterium]
MKKSTFYDANTNGILKNPDPQKSLPTSPRKETINNVLSFAKAYSVRKTSSFDHIELILN